MAVSGKNRNLNTGPFHYKATATLPPLLGGMKYGVCQSHSWSIRKVQIARPLPRSTDSKHGNGPKHHRSF